MKRVNNIPCRLFLIAAFLLLAVNPSWCSSNFTSYPGGLLAGCDVATFPVFQPEGMVILPTGQVLVALFQDGLYRFTMPTSLKNCPTSPPPATRLSTASIRGMAMTLDGTIYGNDENGYVARIDSAGAEHPLSSLGKQNGIGMALDPLTGNIDITVNNGTPKVVEISGLPNNPVAKTIVTLNATVADGLAWSCDGRTLLIADKGKNIFKWDRTTLSHFSFPETPDGIAFGAPGTSLAGFAYVNTNEGQIYQVDPRSPNGSPILEATGGGDGDFVTVDGNGNLLATQTTNTAPPSVITALFWKYGHGTGGFVLPGSTLCMSLHCATQAAATNPECIHGQDATTITALADAACSTSTCGGCASVNLDLDALIVLLKDNNSSGCLSAALTGAEALQSQCPCNPNPLACSQVCTSCPCNPAYCVIEH